MKKKNKIEIMVFMEQKFEFKLMLVIRMIFGIKQIE